MIRTVWVGVNLLLATIPLSLVVIINSYIGRSQKVYDAVPRWWARWLLRASGVNVEVIGAEHIDLERPQVIAANHASWFDVLALAAHMPKPFRFVAKKELARVPLFGRAWLAAGHIAVDRSDTQKAVASLEHAARTIREDRTSIIIFPEGTRSRNGELLPFKKGAFMLSLYNNIPLIPTAVQGTRAIMPRDRWRVRSGRIIVRFGQPVLPQGEIQDRDLFIAHVRAEIERLLAVRVPLDRESNVDYHQHTRS